MARREELRASRRGRYERMVEIRALEDKMLELFGQGVIPGTMHTAQGQEGVEVAIASATTTRDIVTCTYRGHGIALALGVTREAVIGEILGRTSGCMGGLGGSMHLSDPAVGLLPTCAIVGAGIPIAVGAALSARVLNTDAVALAVFGDGATNIGAFHEGLNLAAVWKLPVVFVCENNGYGSHSAIHKTTPFRDLARRAASYDMPSAIVDGQDLDAVETAVADAVERARLGNGPTLVEAKTYRYAGHSRSDAGTYRPAGELDAWRARDPIAIFGGRLIEEHVLRPDDLESIEAEQRALVQATVDEVLAHPKPAHSAILQHVEALAQRER